MSQQGNSQPLENPLQLRLSEAQPICEAAIAAMQRTLMALGLADQIEPMRMDRAEFSVTADPSDGSQSLLGVWKDERGYHIGSIVVHADNSFFAEYGMAVPHPKKSGWFIDAVTAWGRDDVVKSEPRLLPTL